MDWEDHDGGSPEEGEAGRDDEVQGVFNVPAMAMGQVFPGESVVTSMDFHEDGELCVAANSDKSVTLINAVEGRKRKTIHTQKYGCGVVRYTHHDQTVLVSSDADGADHAVRYLSLYDNRFLRFFTGHTDKVVSIAMSPTDDHFMTGSADKTVRLWHLSRPQCLAVLEFPPGHGTPYVAYDQQGLVFAAATSTGKANIIKLYDARNYEKGPFDTFTVEHKKVEEFIVKSKEMRSKKARALSLARWKSMKFSADGQSILIATDASLVLTLHAFEGDVKQVFTGHQNDLHSELDACFTPNAEYVLSGSEDSGIYAWRAEDGKLAKILKGHSSAVGRVLCSPKYEVIASACTNTALWIDAGLEPGQ
ncbi:unnamed protein product [Ectocarpus sp. 4 AP-2014]|uniref:Uncharacterized protein n=1 Tax=Ectocarpus siliculosus TaxID=2880 RepID=D7FS13_ECTSI|nr:conserved unknown protein [Ectocarpus siliculosus]|eukprot:CBJ30954.1 conserved unknown protein [Ectocarpus siliculosus]